MANNQIPIRSLAERFWLKVDKNGPIHPYRPKLGKCWLWTAGLNDYGYGVIMDELPKRIMRRASRVSWQIHIGPIPEAALICHNCDNRRCVNPDHLYVGTHQSNTSDKVKRNRVPRGSQLPHAKLSESQVRQIRATNGRKRFGTSAPNICNILKGRTWKHVK